MARVHNGTFPDSADLKSVGKGCPSLPGGLGSQPAPLELGGTVMDAAKTQGNGVRPPAWAADGFEQRSAGLPNVFDLFTDERMCLAQQVSWLTDLDTARRLEELGLTNDRLHEEQAQAEARMAELEARLGETTDALETICSTLSDELRGPLRCLISLTQLLVKENGWSMNETGKKYAERVTASATRMDTLIQDLLKYGRMSRQTMVCENISLETCLCQVVGGMAGPLSASNAQVSLERPFPQAWGDAATLREVLTQLLDCTVKFAAPEETPAIRIWAESGPAAVRLCIEDQSNGVIAKETDKIVNLSPEMGHVYPDMGIGLALVEKGMEKMGGRAGVEFAPGKGSQFWIELGHSR